jgi:hypothetical protein
MQSVRSPALQSVGLKCAALRALSGRPFTARCIAFFSVSAPGPFFSAMRGSRTALDVANDPKNVANAFFEKRPSQIFEAVFRHFCQSSQAFLPCVSRRVRYTGKHVAETPAVFRPRCKRVARPDRLVIFVCFRAAGDLLFQGSIGRTDLPMSSSEDMAKSLQACR